MLIKMGQEVYAELDKSFRFKYRDVIGDIYHLNDSVNQEIYVHLMRWRGMPEDEARIDLRKRLAGKLDEACVYTGDSIPHSADYIIFVPRALEITPIDLGEEVAHGEHMAQHTRDTCCFMHFLDKFASPTREFVGMLGLYIMAKKQGKPELKFKPPLISEGAVDQNELDHWIGYETVAQLVRTGKDIPFQGLFHAVDQKEVWGMAKEIVTPSLNFPVTEDADKDKVYATVMKTLEECKLDIPFEFA